MFDHHVVLRALIAGLFMALAGLSAGCDSGGPSAPTPRRPDPSAPPGAPLPPTPLPSNSGPRVWTISPNTGSTDGGTPLLIHGERFEAGATVMLEGATTGVTVLSSTLITATSGVHPPGPVDVVVTNPSGESGTLAKGYTYAVVLGGPPPSITSVSPNTGTAGGGGAITVIGSGFQLGAIVRMNGTPLRTYPFGSSSTRLEAQAASAQAPGSVDIIVANPDGQSAILSAGYRYATPGTLNFDGEWSGEADDIRDNHGSTLIKFLIQNDRLVSVTCDGGVEMTIATPTPIDNDEFLFAVEERPLVSGRFQSADQAVGTMNVPPCGLSWVARRHE